jgi:hypothetical protein
LRTRTFLSGPNIIVIWAQIEGNKTSLDPGPQQPSAHTLHWPVVMSDLTNMVGDPDVH